MWGTENNTVMETVTYWERFKNYSLNLMLLGCLNLKERDRTCSREGVCVQNVYEVPREGT
jgi:hypothetical protein